MVPLKKKNTTILRTGTHVMLQWFFSALTGRFLCHLWKTLGEGACREAGFEKTTFSNS
jgi:hypothetical protein